MNKPEVRVIEYQNEQEITSDVSSYEANNLLAKYGYGNTTNHYAPENSMTIDEFARMQDEMNIKKKDGPIAYTFNSRNINYSDTSYKSIDDNIGIQVTIVTDMPIRY